MWLPRGRGRGEGIEWEFGVRRCKLLYIEGINNKVLLYSTQKDIQYLVIIMEKNVKKNVYVYTYICVCVYVYIINHFAVQQKLIQHCKSIKL